MSRTEQSVTVLACDWRGCRCKQQVLGTCIRIEDHGWGHVQLHDGIFHAEVIGDQNGWNSYEFCPEHIKELHTLIGAPRG